MHPAKIKLVSELFNLVFEYVLRYQSILNLFKMGLYWAAYRWVGAKYHTYPTMMKLGSYTLPTEYPKNM